MTAHDVKGAKFACWFKAAACKFVAVCMGVRVVSFESQHVRRLSASFLVDRISIAAQAYPAP